jgi:hypothetical protein
MAGRAGAGFGGGLVGLLAVIALFSTAVHATTTANQQLTHQAVVSAQRSDDYYSCLEAQSHSVVGPHDVVFVSDASLSNWVTINKVVGGWAHTTLSRDKATVALDLEHIGGRGTCEGDALVSIRVAHDGRVVMRRGR